MIFLLLCFFISVFSAHEFVSIREQQVHEVPGNCFPAHVNKQLPRCCATISKLCFYRKIQPLKLEFYSHQGAIEREVLYEFVVILIVVQVTVTQHNVAPVKHVTDAGV